MYVRVHLGYTECRRNLERKTPYCFCNFEFITRDKAVFLNRVTIIRTQKFLYKTEPNIVSQIWSQLKMCSARFLHMCMMNDKAEMRFKGASLIDFWLIECRLSSE